MQWIQREPAWMTSIVKVINHVTNLRSRWNQMIRVSASCSCHRQRIKTMHFHFYHSPLGLKISCRNCCSINSILCLYERLRVPITTSHILSSLVNSQRAPIKLIKCALLIVYLREAYSWLRMYEASIVENFLAWLLANSDHAGLINRWQSYFVLHSVYLQS